MMIWRKLNKSSLSDAKTFLGSREQYCVSAISRFKNGAVNNVWAHSDSAKGSGITALLLYGNRILFPVFNFSPSKIAELNSNYMKLPRFFPFVLRSDSLHAAQGLAGDMNLLENSLGKKGFIPFASYDYDLLILKLAGDPRKSRGSPPGLLIRRPEAADADALFPLQAGYETEEVLPPGSMFNPAACRKTIEFLITEKTILTAELEGRLVGKININALSFSLFQIGGVYVLPEYRNLGIAHAMTHALIEEMAFYKKDFTLFVKKKNTPARRVYDSLGFVKISDYRISYFM